jgi:hypothetical protein
MSVTLLDQVAEILLRHDPIKIYFPEYGNTDEYMPEARQIAARLASCESMDACLDVVYLVFVQYFGSSTAGERAHYAPIAKDLWTLHHS